MKSTATLKYLRSAPRKARLVADAVRGKMVGDALSLLEFSITKGVAKDFAKVIKSAVANLQSKKSDTPVDVDDLRVADIQVSQGPTQKRFRPRAQGRAGRILKRTCHITVVVSN